MHEPTILSFSNEVSFGLYMDDFDNVNVPCHTVAWSATAKPGRMAYMAQMSEQSLHPVYVSVANNWGI